MQTDLIEITMKCEQIGKIEMGIDGCDEYVRLRANESTTVDQAHEWLLNRVYRDTNQAGGYFCHQVTIMPRPYFNDEFVGIIHHRYDV